MAHVVRASPVVCALDSPVRRSALVYYCAHCYHQHPSPFASDRESTGSVMVPGTSRALGADQAF